MNLGPWEILIIAVVIVLLFGARKMPAMARSLGQSMRILKAETKGMKQDDAQDDAASAQAKEQQQLSQAQQPQQLSQAKQDQQRTTADHPQAHKNAS